MAEEETGVDDVKPTDIVGWIGDIRPAILDRLYVVGGGFIASDRQLGLIHIKAKDLTRNADPAGKLASYVTSSTPDIQARHSGTHTNSVQEILGPSLPNVTQHTKPFTSGAAAPDRVSCRHDKKPPRAVSGSWKSVNIQCPRR